MSDNKFQISTLVLDAVVYRDVSHVDDDRPTDDNDVRSGGTSRQHRRQKSQLTHFYYATALTHSI